MNFFCFHICTLCVFNFIILYYSIEHSLCSYFTTSCFDILESLIVKILISDLCVIGTNKN